MITTVKINKRTNHIERQQHKDTTVEEQADLANDAGFEAIWIEQGLTVMSDAVNVVVIFENQEYADK